MKREEFYLYSALPMTELRDRLDLEVRVQNNLRKKEFKIVLNWKDESRFTVYRMDYESGSGGCRSIRVGHKRLSLSIGFGESRWTSYSAVFCGQIAPDGEGSVLYGHFGQVALGWFVGGVALASIIMAVLMGRADVALVLTVMSAPAFWMLIRPERTGGAGKLWDTLEYLVETVDGLAAEESKQKEDDQDKE